MQKYKFLNHIVLCNVFFAIICIPTAGKLIDVMGIPLSISIYYFPFVYIFADIMTEVYGYAVAGRFVVSTLCGQTVNTVVFYLFGLWGIIPTRVLTKSILAASLTKVSVELILLPVTLKTSSWLKRIENVDYFDRATNFNPLKF